MRLTSFADYGLRALMRMAAEPERRFTSEEIATEFDLSRNHLAKIVRTLAVAEIVTTRKGAGGGFRLAPGAGAMTLGQIVRVLEEGTALVECFRADGGNCLLTPTCRLKGALRDGREAFLAALDRTTLSECAWSPGKSGSAFPWTSPPRV